MSFSEKLYQNFIEDDRWLLLVNGLKVTILVTLFALLVGVIIGFTVAIIRSLHDKTGKFKILNAICRNPTQYFQLSKCLFQILNLDQYFVLIVHLCAVSFPVCS